MLKSLKLGELGMDTDPLLLPSDCRSDVLRSKVRNIVDLHWCLHKCFSPVVRADFLPRHDSAATPRNKQESPVIQYKPIPSCRQPSLAEADSDCMHVPSTRCSKIALSNLHSLDNVVFSKRIIHSKHSKDTLVCRASEKCLDEGWVVRSAIHGRTDLLGL